MCETMFGDAFTYETDEENAFTMWFEGRENPNADIARRIDDLEHVNDSDHDMCYTQSYHHFGEPLQNQNFGECRPFSSSACCLPSTVSSAEALRTAYGGEFEWDRCGPLSPACERYFVQEACFYECDPVIGHYRRYPNHANINATAITGHSRPTYQPKCDSYSSSYDPSSCAMEHNTWEILRMPIKASYCNDWFAACANDLFCASNNGNFFECAAEYVECDEAEELRQRLENLTADLNSTTRTDAVGDDDEISTGLLVGLLVAAVALVIVVVALAYMISRERGGAPIFTPLENADTEQVTPNGAFGFLAQ